MKSIKKNLLILLAFWIGFTLVSCSNDDEPDFEELVYAPNNPDIAKVSFTTGFKEREDFRFYVSHTSEIQVDWGKGERQTYPANSYNFSLLSGNVENGLVKIYSKNSDAITSVDLNRKMIKKIDLKNAIAVNELMLFGNEIYALNLATNVTLKKINISENKFKTIDLDATLNTLHRNNTAESPGVIIIGDSYDGNQKPSQEIVNSLKQFYWTVDQN